MMKFKKNLYDYLYEAAKEDATRQFLFNEEIRLTFQDALDAVISTANKLYKCGIMRGELVAFRMTRSIESIIIFFALQTLGAVSILIDPHNKVDVFLSSLEVDFKEYFTITNEHASNDISARGNWIVIDKTSHIVTHPNISNFSRNEQVLYDHFVDVMEPSIILFSSGSTGKNKAAIFNQFAMIENTFSLLNTCEYSKESVVIATLPLCHMYALACIIYTSLIVRHSVFVPLSLETLHIVECMERYKINFLIGVPSMYKALLTEYNSKLPIIKGIGMISGAPCDSATFKAIEDGLGITLFQLYGMTEGGTFASSKTNINRDMRISSVGKMMSRRKCAIIGEDGLRQKVGQIGEICVKSPSLMLGYYNDRAATSQVIDRSGFLHTGDLGYVDVDKNLYITGRKKEIIIRNGINLSTNYIQNKIANLAFVKDCVVIGINDDIVGEVPVAAVVLNDGYSMSSIELKGAIAGVLTKIEIPDKIIIVDSLPMTPTGKIDKKMIRIFFKF